MYLILRLTPAAIEKIGLDTEDTAVQGMTILDAYANEHEVSIILRDRVYDANLLAEQDLGADDDEDSEDDPDLGADDDEDSEDDPDGE